MLCWDWRDFIQLGMRGLWLVFESQKNSIRSKARGLYFVKLILICNKAFKNNVKAFY